MKIAVPSSLPCLEAHIGNKLRQSKYLLIIDLDSMEYEAILNPLPTLNGPAAGMIFAQILIYENVKLILADHHNSNISKYLENAGIQIIDGKSGSIQQVVKQFEETCLADTIVIPIKVQQD
jgi:predicted Fe-Mo cluster-binding NifX family protein